MEQFEKIYLYKRIVSAKIFIDNNFAQRVDLDNIADHAHFSKFHFIRLFKSIYGLTPKNYLIKTRIDKAKTLLEEGCHVAETSFMIGLESPSSFTGMFKKITGQTPSAYQKQYLERRQNMQDNPLHFIPNCFIETHSIFK